MFGVYLLVLDFLEESLKANKHQRKFSLILRASIHSILYKIYPRNSDKNSFWLVQEKFLYCMISSWPVNCIIEAIAKQMFVYSCQ